MEWQQEECPYSSSIFFSTQYAPVNLLTQKVLQHIQEGLGRVMGNLWSPQPLILPYFSLYFFPEFTLRNSCNISRKISGPVVGSVGSPQTLILPYFSLYFSPGSIIAPQVHSLRLTVGFNLLHLSLQEQISCLFLGYTSPSVSLWLWPCLYLQATLQWQLPAQTTGCED